ncbi:hypothetical protein [Rhizobium sp. Leaf453]|uniref:hypothetical protein n=1 Tax=Rhizobium sp. Leaf453 TaxID=1736380 RepID=UPI0007156406|nr:hypothetical protein [Rhizobium sp. Leaf453]KQU06035.1 hypothetical protein ASG68_25190 [Rhizobium sp. Leaf453]
MIDAAIEVQQPISAPRADEERICVHPGRFQWGCFGLERGRNGPRFWCKEHLPDDYWAPAPVN